MHRGANCCEKSTQFLPELNIVENQAPWHPRDKFFFLSKAQIVECIPKTGTVSLKEIELTNYVILMFVLQNSTGFRYNSTGF